MNYMEINESIKEKELNELTLLDLAFVHVNGRKFSEIKDGMLISVIPLVLREIGHAKVNIYSQNFLPISAVFTVLDQLGFCYSRKDMPAYNDPNASGIKKALYYFCGFSQNDEDTKALNALRNSFLHSASCLSKAKFPGQPSYRFSIDRAFPELIKHSEASWNGDFENLTEQMWTHINYDKLIDLAESAVTKVLDCWYQGTLNVECSGTELRHRFLKFNSI